MRRVVITGLGAITPIGNNTESFWESIKSGKTGFAPITRFDTSEYKCKLAAEVKDFIAQEHMDKKSARRMELFSQYGVAAATEAFKDAGIDMEKENPYRIGCSVGSGIGSLQAIEREHLKILEKGPSKVSPLFIPMMISNMAAGNISIALGIQGKNINVSTACATGTHSIGEAMRAIQYGEADVMFAGGTEGCITPLGVAGFSALNALSEVSCVKECSLPFDSRRSGFVMGEGAGVLVLEELTHAKERKAKIYAELMGYGTSGDAYHITSPREDGSGAAEAMKNAIYDAGLSLSDIKYINAHGTGTQLNDLFETRAIKALFKEAAYDMKINSTKSMIGHLLGAAGAVECIACVKEIEEGFVHKTVGFVEAEEEMDLDYCKESSEEELEYALSNSLGFGGHNASLVIGKYRE